MHAPHGAPEPKQASSSWHCALDNRLPVSHERPDANLMPGLRCGDDDARFAPDVLASAGLVSGPRLAFSSDTSSALGESGLQRSACQSAALEHSIHTRASMHARSTSWALLETQRKYEAHMQAVNCKSTACLIAAGHCAPAAGQHTGSIWQKLRQTKQDRQGLQQGHTWSGPQRPGG